MVVELAAVGQTKEAPTRSFGLLVWGTYNEVFFVMEVLSCVKAVWALVMAVTAELTSVVVLPAIVLIEVR